MRWFLSLSLGVLLLASVAVASSGGATQVEARWVITDLGTLGGDTSRANDINERGQVVGFAFRNESKRVAVLWEDGTMRDLGALGRWNSWADDINERGQVVGASVKNGRLQAFLWEDGKWRDLGTLPGRKESEASAINDSGQIIGRSRKDTDSYPYWGFLWQKGKMRNLGTLGGPGSDATAINERGQVVGSSETKAKDEDGNPIPHAFLWQNGKMRDLGTLGGSGSWALLGSSALDINERGQVVGSSGAKAKRDGIHAFLWQNGKLRDLGTFGGPNSEPRAVNRQGFVAGWADTRKTSAADRHEGEVCGDWKYRHPAPHAFLWKQGRLIDLGTLGGLESEAQGINDKGQVVGWADTKRIDSDDCPVGHAFVWENGTMTDLGTLPGGKESEAVAINNKGQIVGWSDTKSGASHAVVWTLKP